MKLIKAMFDPLDYMKIFKLNTFKIMRNILLHRSIRIILVYSLLYLTTLEIFAENTFGFNNSKNEYLISVSQNSIELNLTERNHRIKTTDHSRFNYDKAAIICYKLDAQYAEYLEHDFSYSVIFSLLLCNSNHSFRAPPIH